MRIAYIANGSLWLQEAAGAPREIESRFARESRERATRSAKANAWKHAARDEQRGLIPNNMLWRQRGNAELDTPPRFEHVVAGANPDVLFYVLTVGRSSGLFEYRISEDREIRILHSADFSCDGLWFEAATGNLVISRAGGDGRTHLEVIDTNGNSRGLLTGGDCEDLSPSIAPGDADGVYFQSSGLAVHPNQGYVMAVGNAVVHRFDRRTKEVTTVLERPESDCLSPRADGAGNLFYIRRPYVPPNSSSVGDTLKDVLMFPWRMLMAIFGYLNFFSMIYGKEPLKSAGGPRGPNLEQDLGQLWLHGRMIELSKVRYENRRGTRLVPNDWQLIRRDKQGVEAIVASGVACFDIAGDGTVLYSDGFSVHAFPNRGRKDAVATGDLIHRVAVLA